MTRLDPEWEALAAECGADTTPATFGDVVGALLIVEFAETMHATIHALEERIAVLESAAGCAGQEQHDRDAAKGLTYEAV